MDTLEDAAPVLGQPRLLDQIRNVIRRLHYSTRTEHAYIDWIRRLILFHRKRHPAEKEFGGLEVFTREEARAVLARLDEIRWVGRGSERRFHGLEGGMDGPVGAVNGPVAGIRASEVRVSHRVGGKRTPVGGRNQSSPRAECPRRRTSAASCARPTPAKCPGRWVC